MVALSAPVPQLPLMPLLPDQPPDAVQLVALVEDQLNVDAEPLLTVPGLALRLTVGVIGAEGGTDCPVTVTLEEDWLSPDVLAHPDSPAISTAHNRRSLMPDARPIPLSATRIHLRP